MNDITNKSGIGYSYKIDPNGSASTKNVESNVTTTSLITPTLQMTMTADKAYATINDIINYTVTLNNSGNILLSDIMFKDALPTGLEFVTGSVKVDNTAQPTYDIATGFSLGSMIILVSKTVTFQARVKSLPSPNTVKNKATTTFNYLVTSIVQGSSASNEVSTTINVTNLSIVKSANVNAVEAGDEITYTIVVTNSGNIDATNITFTDVLDSKLTFSTGSVKVNGTAQAAYNPNTGFSLPNITPTGNVTVEFKATVND